jgi:hypothetical protein
MIMSVKQSLQSILDKCKEVDDTALGHTEYKVNGTKLYHMLEGYIAGMPDMNISGNQLMETVKRNEGRERFR